MKARLTSWADRRLIDGGAPRPVFGRAAEPSRRLAAILVTLPALMISDEVKALIGWQLFAANFFLLSVVGLVARFLKQPEKSDGED